MLGINLKEKANQIAEIPNQIEKMTVAVVMLGIVSLFALLMSMVAVFHAN